MLDISVVIPTYNRAHSIRKAVESVLNQTYPVREIIIVDDCSSDGTEDVINSLNNTKIAYYRLPENRGAGGARNYGVSKAQSEYIAFHDSDDECYPSKLEKQAEYISNHPECKFVYSAIEVTFQQSGESMIFPGENWKNKLSGDILAELLVRNSIDAPTMFMKKDIFEEVGGFDEGMRSLEDWDLAIRVAQKYSIGYVPEPLLKSIMNEGGVSSNVAAYYKSRCHMLRKYRKDYLETNTFDLVVENILDMARKDGIASQIEKMMLLYLSQ